MRYVLIDRLLELEPGVRVLAERAFPPDEEMFADHFPGAPIVPGALLIEAMAQTGGWLVTATLDFTRWPLLTMVDRAKFRSPVAPGRRILIDGALRATRGGSFEVSARASVEGTRVATARLLFHTMDPALLFGTDGFPDWGRRGFETLGGKEALARPFRDGGSS